MHVTWPAYRLRRTQRVEERDAIGYDFDEMPVYDLQEEGFFFIDKKANYICMLMDDCEDLFVAGNGPPKLFTPCSNCTISNSWEFGTRVQASKISDYNTSVAISDQGSQPQAQNAALMCLE